MNPPGIIMINMDVFGGTFRHGPITLKCYKVNFVGKPTPHDAEVMINEFWVKNLKEGDLFPELEMKDLEEVL